VTDYHECDSRDYCDERASEAIRLHAVLEETHKALTKIIEPWLGIRADIIPLSVSAVVVLCNEVHNALSGSR
jgi:hypothetical protein